MSQAHTKETESHNMPGNVAQLMFNFGRESHPFYLFDTPLGRSVATDVLQGRCYPIHPCFGEIHTIIDIGANIGAAALFFAISYPQARVFAFEPAPQTYSLLAQNTQWIDRIMTFNFGLDDQDRQANLYLGAQDSVTNSVHSSQLNTADTIEVTLRNIRAVVSELSVDKIDILKLDTEGCELPILRSLADYIPHIGVVFVEYHSETDRLEIDRLLSNSHILFTGHINHPHRGEFCYLAKTQLPQNYRDAQIK